MNRRPRTIIVRARSVAIPLWLLLFMIAGIGAYAVWRDLPAVRVERERLDQRERERVERLELDRVEATLADERRRIEQGLEQPRMPWAEFKQRQREAGK